MGCLGSTARVLKVSRFVLIPRAETCRHRHARPEVKCLLSSQLPRNRRLRRQGHMRGHQGQPGEVTQRRKDGCAAGKSLSWGFFRKEQAGQAKPAYVLLVCIIPVDCGVQGLSQLSGTQPWVIRAGGQ